LKVYTIPVHKYPFLDIFSEMEQFVAKDASSESRE